MLAGARRLIVVLGVAAATLGLGAGQAAARKLVTHSLSSSFDGALSTAGPFGSRVASVAVDEATGDVYVLTNNFVIDKFDQDGNPSAFTAPSLGGANSLTVLPSQETYAPNLHIYVDNSNTATHGRIYVVFASFSEIVYAFEPDGSPVGGNYPLHVGFLTGLSVDPRSGNLWMGVRDGYTSEYTAAGVPTGFEVPIPSRTQLGGGGGSTGVDTNGNIYLGHGEGQGTGIDKYDAAGTFLYNLAAFPLNNYPEFKVDPTTNDLYQLTTTDVNQYGESGSRIWQFGGGSLSGAMGLAVNGASGRVYVARAGGANVVDIYAPGGTVTVPDTATGDASDFEGPEATVHGTVNADGVDTTGCRFEWSTNTSFGESTPCAEGEVLSGSTDEAVSARLTGLRKGLTYNYRLVATNANGPVVALIHQFVASETPSVSEEWATNVHSDGAQLHSEITAEGAPTQYFFEYGTADCAISTCSQTVAKGLGSGLEVTTVDEVVSGLKPGTEYHYRVVARNQSGTAYGPDRTFTTFPITEILEDHCPNAHVRQQVGAALLPDCRAYELVSAPDTGGYNVESDLVSGEDPFGGYPDANGRVLYGVHAGAIPGPWDPTNRGVDPYVATRGEHGWTTTYAGIPADNPFASGPFSSTLDEANATLTAMAFGGEDICAPCFEDGSTGIPLRKVDGSLEQGMAGSESPRSPAESDGLVRKRFSADGTHLVFGSTSQFEPDGNANTGDVSIYDRNLETGVTQVVSTDPSGHNLSCLQGAGNCHSPGDTAGIAELDISANGSRIVVGQLVSTDAEGNHYFHLYMHIGDSPKTVDLTPGTTSGVQYDGMTSDGSIVYFTTVDPLVTAKDQDTDTSADIYRADVSASGATLTRVSTGEEGTGNTDSCNPAGDPDSWNAPSGQGKCNAMAFAGGAGVATHSGAIYFLSPERLDTSDPANLPVQDQANLYLAKPGSSPRFVTTIDTSEGKPGPPPPGHPVVNSALVSELNTAEGITVDQSSGDLYVIERTGANRLSRYTASGAPDNFAVPGGSNSIEISPGGAGRSQVAIDNAPTSPLKGTIYVKTEFYGIGAYAPSGEAIGNIDEFEFPACGVAVEQSTGAVYASAAFEETVWRFEPVSGTAPVSAEANYVKTGIHTTGMSSPCNLAVGNDGHVYVSAATEGPLLAYEASDFTASVPATEGTLVTPLSRAVSVDPSSNDVYVDEGDQIAVFDSSGNLIQRFGAGAMGSTSRGVAIDASTKHVYATTGSTIVDFGYEVLPFTPVDNPAIRHAALSAEAHRYGDFQVTPDGHYAAFASLLPLTGYDSDDNYEVFRYDAESGQLDCASCNPTNSRPEGGSMLPSAGLGLAEDGHVFFNSNDAIAPRDLDRRQDAYEWDGSSPQLISTGGSPFDSSLLGISRDGTDAYFFTYDTLVPEDQNGTLVKLYDARANGGFEFFPPQVPCKASDECHGAGSPAPGPLPIRTIVGHAGNWTSAAAKSCRRGFVRRGHACVRRRHGKHRKRHHKKHHRAHHRSR